MLLSKEGQQLQAEEASRQQGCLLPTSSGGTSPPPRHMTGRVLSFLGISLGCCCNVVWPKCGARFLPLVALESDERRTSLPDPLAERLAYCLAPVTAACCGGPPHLLTAATASHLPPAAARPAGGGAAGRALVLGRGFQGSKAILRVTLGMLASSQGWRAAPGRPCL